MEILLRKISNTINQEAFLRRALGVLTASIASMIMLPIAHASNITEPPTLSMSVNPTTVTTGDPAVLSWHSENADQCSAAGAWSGIQPLSGNMTIYPTKTVTYALTCGNNAGYINYSVTVTLNSNETSAQPTLSMDVNPSTINQGDQSVLSWHSVNASQCVAAGGWSGSRPLSGTLIITPSQSTTYTLTCYNSGGYVNSQTTITVQAITSSQTPSTNSNAQNPTASLFVSSSQITPGQTVTLSWSSTNAQQCLATGGWSGTQPLSGSLTVTPVTTTTYSLSCTNSYGSGYDSKTVLVNSTYNPNPYYPYTNNYTYDNQSTIYGSNNSNPLNAVCVISPVDSATYKSVSFTAGVSGGSQPYTYKWSGDVSGNQLTAKAYFTTPGIKNAYLTVHDSTNQVATASCSTIIHTAAVAYVNNQGSASQNSNTQTASSTSSTNSEATSTVATTTTENTVSNVNSEPVVQTSNDSQSTAENGKRSLLASLFLNNSNNPSMLTYILLVVVFLIVIAAVVINILKK